MAPAFAGITDGMRMEVAPSPGICTVLPILLLLPAIWSGRRWLGQEGWACDGEMNNDLGNYGES